jgi:mitogen-activated protein kinase kinase kinase 9
MRMGECYLLLLTSKGEVYTMGENIESQLGMDVTHCDTPTRVGNIPLVA